MNNLQPITDKTAISLSLLCTLHCLVLPIVVVMLPSISALPLEDEIFHVWLVFAILPISIYALTMGCRKHKSRQVLLVGALGLIILASTALLGHEVLSHDLEKILTVLGSVAIAYAHFLNYRLCQLPENCEC